jgi:hypothetical protein
MLARLEPLREAISARDPRQVALLSGSAYSDHEISLPYWGDLVIIEWSDLAMRYEGGESLPTFDVAMLSYYLHTADGTPMADRWIGFRELPDGTFYNQAFQGYTGNRLAQAFGSDPNAFEETAASHAGMKLPALADYAFALMPLPRIRLAAVLWPGDEEMPSKASVLFDAAASHYLPTDGLALLASGIVGRFISTYSKGGAPKG